MGDSRHIIPKLKKLYESNNQYPPDVSESVRSLLKQVPEPRGEVLFHAWDRGALPDPEATVGPILNALVETQEDLSFEELLSIINRWQARQTDRRLWSAPGVCGRMYNFVGALARGCPSRWSEAQTSLPLGLRVAVIMALPECRVSSETQDEYLAAMPSFVTDAFSVADTWSQTQRLGIEPARFRASVDPVLRDFTPTTSWVFQPWWVALSSEELVERVELLKKASDFYLQLLLERRSDPPETKLIVAASLRAHTSALHIAEDFEASEKGLPDQLLSLLYDDFTASENQHRWLSQASTSVKRAVFEKTQITEPELLAKLSAALKDPLVVERAIDAFVLAARQRDDDKVSAAAEDLARIGLSLLSVLDTVYDALLAELAEPVAEAAFAAIAIRSLALRVLRSKPGPLEEDQLRYLVGERRIFDALPPSERDAIRAAHLADRQVLDDKLASAWSRVAASWRDPIEPKKKESSPPTRRRRIVS